jgi:TetR/AcrR family transcriptional regulator
MSGERRPRLAAEARRALVLDTACRVFAASSYRGTTTAEIAREADVTEPVLYRHFASKRDLYLACLGEAWRRVRSVWEGAIETEREPGEWPAAMTRAFQQMDHSERAVLSTLWVQSLSEASEDPEIRKYATRHLREVHEFVADVMRRAQEAGGIPEDRDVVAEAWIFTAIGLLGSIGRRLGALPEEDLARIRESRHRWLTGRA